MIDRQWAAISQFHDIIMKASDSKISSSSATVDDTIEAMISVILLKNSKGIFEELLQKRHLELSNQLQKPLKTVKNHITYSLTAISSVLVTVHKAFFEKELEKRIEIISEEKTLHLLNVSVESPVMEFLPSIIKDFKLISDADQNEILETSYVQDKCAKWLDDIHEVLTKETCVILSHVHNITGLSNIRSGVFSFIENSSLLSILNSTCQDLLGHELNLWQEFYRNLFRDRIEAIIGTHFNGSIYFLQSSLYGVILDHFYAHFFQRN